MKVHVSLGRDIFLYFCQDHKNNSNNPPPPPRPGVSLTLFSVWWYSAYSASCPFWPPVEYSVPSAPRSVPPGISAPLTGFHFPPEKTADYLWLKVTILGKGQDTRQRSRWQNRAKVKVTILGSGHTEVKLLHNSMNYIICIMRPFSISILHYRCLNLTHFRFTDLLLQPLSHMMHYRSINRTVILWP